MVTLLYNTTMDVFFEQHKPASSIANYLSLGSKHNKEQTLGFELEHFVVEKGSLALVPYSVGPDSTDPSVEKLLHRMKIYYSESIYETIEDGSSHLFALERDKATITLEPGAQLEISIGPACSLGEIEKLYGEFRSELDPLLDDMGLELLELGYHPTSRAEEIPLLPKHRYRHMDTYFAGTGKHGICMMRATASTQVSIDYSNEEDAIKKLRVANALGPFFAFITDNSPVFEQEPVGACGGTTSATKSGLAVPHRMARMVCWDDTDPQRSLIVKGAFEESFSFLKYAEALIEAPGIFLPPVGKDDMPEYLGLTSFKKRLLNEFIDEEMILHILSLFFFDARFKTYLELRQADALPFEYALSYTALISGIFYNPQALEFYSDCFFYTDSPEIAFAKSSLRKYGYAAEVYGRKATEWLDELIDFASTGLREEDLPYLAPLAELVRQRRSLLSGTEQS